jgi:hypothetical protein
VEVLEGRRARYVSPVRVYLVASVTYFLLAALIPNVAQPPSAAIPGSRVTINLAEPDAVERLSEEQRAELRRSLARAPWWVRPVLQSAADDPAGFVRRMRDRMPRVLFGLVPVFALVVALFYRRRPFSQHLVFALHLHAVAFIAQMAPEIANLTGRRVVVAAAGLGGLAFFGWFAPRALERVYGGPRRMVLLKGACIALLYAIIGAVTVVATVFVSSIT